MTYIKNQVGAQAGFVDNQSQESWLGAPQATSQPFINSTAKEGLLRVGITLGPIYNPLRLVKPNSAVIKPDYLSLKFLAGNHLVNIIWANSNSR
jgi:hypothetical protein